MSSHARFVVPATTRSRLILEVASELVGGADWVERQSKVSLRRQGQEDWPLTLGASDSPRGLEEVARGELQVGIINPSEPLTLAYRGTGPFTTALPLRAITVLPSEDQMGFAVAARTGLTSLEAIKEQHYPLRLSLRSQRQHSCHLFVQETLKACGFGLEDIEAWGGEVRYDAPIAHAPSRFAALERGDADAVFDEAVNRWVPRALELGMRLLPLSESLLGRMESLGFRRGLLARQDYPGLSEDVRTLDFSGWTVFTHADTPDSFVTAFCAALETRKDRIPWQGEGPLPLERMCRDGAETPLDVPLHPAAQQFWHSQGYL